MSNSATEVPELNICAFDDYRDFLREVYEVIRELKPVYSYEYCSRRLKTTKSYLILLFQKKRHSSQNKIWEIAELFGLSSFQRKYLMFLFLENTTEEAEAKGYFQEILNNFKDRAMYHLRSTDQLPSSPIILRPSSSSGARLVYKSWLHTALVCLPKVHDFKYDIEWMMDRLNLDAGAKQSVMDALRELIEVGALVEANGTLAQSEFYYTEANVEDLDQYRDYRPFLEKAIEALGNVHLHRSFSFQGRGFALSTENCRLVVDASQEYFAKIMEIEQRDQVREWVLLMTNNVFNITPRPECR